MRQFVLWPSNRLDLESLRRDISGLLGGSYKTEACFEISAMKQEFIKRNYPDGGGWSARIHVTNEEGFGLIEVSDMRAHMFTMLASRCRAFAGLFVLWMGSFWVTNHWVQTKLQDQMVCKWSRYQTRLCTLQLMSLKAIFKLFLSTKSFCPLQLLVCAVSMQPRSSRFCMAQTGARIYFVMVRKDVANHGQMKGLVHLVTTVLPSQLQFLSPRFWPMWRRVQMPASDLWHSLPGPRIPGFWGLPIRWFYK